MATVLTSNRTRQPAGQGNIQTGSRDTRTRAAWLSLDIPQLNQQVLHRDYTIASVGSRRTTLHLAL